MSKNVAVFVDVANLYYAARGQDVDVDYVALLKHATKGRDLIRAYAYSGLDPENENQKKFLDFLGKNGYRVVAKDIRKFGDGRVKANLDIELVVDLFRLADRMDVAVIVSGDGDFAPAIRALQDHGVRCEVISFRPNTSSDLFAVADEFHDVMKISAIGRQKDAKGVGAPEMPAKEVNPDVGFREASPSVAAAAIAAIRGNGEETPASGRGTGRGTGSRRSDRPARGTRGGRSRSAPEGTAESAEAAVAADAGVPAASAVAAETAADSAHRRRRRGGRGRGRRGRRGDATDLPETTDAAEPAEIGWQEVDSLEELEGLGTAADAGADRAYEFEEADAATLAELGLTDQPESQPAKADSESPAKRKPRARKAPTTSDASGAKASAAPNGAAEAAPKSAPKPRSRAKAAPPPTAEVPATEAPATEAPATEAGKPAPKSRSGRTSRAKSASGTDATPAAGTPAAGADEGIWKRFTSGRPSRKRTTPEPPAEG